MIKALALASSALVGGAVAGPHFLATPTRAHDAATSLYDLHATDIHGQDFDLGAFNNTVTLVVNVATY